MFTERIASPISPLTTNYMNDKIHRPQDEPDYALSCLGVALFARRIQNFEGFYGRIGLTGFGQSLCQDVIDTLECRKGMTKEECLKKPSFRYYYVPSIDSAKELSEEMKNAGLQELPQVKAFLSQELSLVEPFVYIDKDTNSAFVVVPTPHIQVYHMVIAFVGTMYPMMFEDKPLTAQEVGVLKTLTNKTAHKFISSVGEMMKDLKEDILRYELALCFRGFRMQKIHKAEQEMNEIRMAIEDYMERYRLQYEKLETATAIYEGLLSTNSDENNEQEKEAVEYVSTCPRLHNVNFANGKLSFDVDTVLTNFDTAKWRNAINNKDIYNGYRLDPDNVFSNSRNRQIFLQALFSSNDPELQIKIRGRFYLQIDRAYMEVERGSSYSYTGVELSNCLTNPHFLYHGCPGTNRDQVMACLRAADIVSAIECCIAATGSVNIGETEITFRPFVRELLTSDKKIIRRVSDGADLTTAEALMWLLTKQGEKTE